MGSYSPPPGQKTGSPRPQPVKTASPQPNPALPPDNAPGEVTGSIGIPPPLPPQLASRLKLPEKKMPLGPKVSTIFGTIVLAALVIFLIQRAPSRLVSMQLQKYVGEDRPTLEWGNPRMCSGTAGCLTIYLSTDKDSEKAIENCVALADDVAEKGIETVFVIGKDNVKSCARLARMIRRQVLFDPHGEWADQMHIKQIPHFIVYTTTGEVKLRTSETPAAASVTGAFQ